jgi:hypothetical protein
MSETGRKIAREFHLDGRLVKEISFVELGDSRFENWVPGRHRWLLDGTDITEAEAERLIAQDEA